MSAPIPTKHSDALDRVFFALADPTRRAILERLKGGDVGVNDLVVMFSMSQPAISKHLKVLESAGLVSRSRAGAFRPCHLETAPLRSADDWLRDYRAFYEATAPSAPTTASNTTTASSSTAAPTPSTTPLPSNRCSSPSSSSTTATPPPASR